MVILKGRDDNESNEDGWFDDGQPFIDGSGFNKVAVQVAVQVAVS